MNEKYKAAETNINECIRILTNLISKDNDPLDCYSELILVQVQAKLSKAMSNMAVGRHIDEDLANGKGVSK